MIDIQLTEQELNTILHGLYVLEDQVWYTDSDFCNSLIQKLNLILPKDSQE